LSGVGGGCSRRAKSDAATEISTPPDRWSAPWRPDPGGTDLLAESEPEAIAAARRHLAYFPSSADAGPPEVEPRAAAASCADLEALIPREENKPFDMRLVIERIVDGGSLFEIKELYASEILTGLARIERHPVGIVANQPGSRAASSSSTTRSRRGCGRRGGGGPP